MKKQSPIKSTILFLYLSLCIGFPLGLWVLLAGPSKWLAEYAHATDMEISQENIYGKLIIVVYLIVSFLLAFFLYKFIKSSKNTPLKWFITGTATLILLVSVYIFSFNPQWLISYSGSNLAKSTTNKADKYQHLEFVYGSYPNEEMIQSLKEEGYDGIISLLHEKVIPAEPALMNDEKKLGDKYGIKIVNFPMMPWVSENGETLQKAKKFIENEKGLYYVHCYLGRDRVNIFKAAAKKFGAITKSEKNTTIRKIEESHAWARGEFYKLEEGVYLTPYPTDDEFMMYVLNGHFKTVVSLLNNKVEDNQKWIVKEQQLLKDYSINYVHFPTTSSFNEKDIVELKKLINSNEKPILIHSFLSKDSVSKFIIGNY